VTPLEALFSPDQLEGRLRDYCVATSCWSPRAPLWEPTVE